MFYEPPESTDQFLRLGDVVEGYVSFSAKITEPFLSFERKVYHNYNIDIEVPTRSVVLTPCCSIEDQMISLTPLIQLRSDFLKNDYYSQDFTRINRVMAPKLAFPPDEWEKIPGGEKREIESRADGYAHISFFVYSSNELFNPYELRRQQVKHYMIDFRNIQTIKCALIKTKEQREKSGKEEPPILKSKLLQLSVSTRKELRDKLSNYFWRSNDIDID